MALLAELADRLPVGIRSEDVRGTLTSHPAEEPMGELQRRLGSFGQARRIQANTTAHLSPGQHEQNRGQPDAALLWYR